MIHFYARLCCLPKEGLIPTGDLMGDEKGVCGRAKEGKRKNWDWYIKCRLLFNYERNGYLFRSCRQVKWDRTLNIARFCRTYAKTLLLKIFHA